MKVDYAQGKYYLNKKHETPLSYWIDSTPKTNYPSLREDIAVDVAVIGGGMAGISSAYLLAQEGLKVAVLEANQILQGTTGHTTAKLSSQHGLIYDQIIRQRGDEIARLYAEANEFAISFVANLVEQEGIDCDFTRQSAYIYTQQEMNIEKLEKELKAAQQCGIDAHYETKLALPLAIKGALRFDQQAQFHPRKYLLALAQRITEKGGLIFENSKVIDVRGDYPATLMTHQGCKVTAKYVIMASHYPFHILPGFYVARIYQEREYAVVIKASEAFPGGMYINAEDPARSLRGLPTTEGERILIVGEKHRTGHGENLVDHYKNLMEFAQGLFTVEEFPYYWSTQDCSTLDDIPYIGQISKDKHNIFMATGFRKWGMTHSTVAAHVIRDIIVKGDSPWGAVYAPSRKITLNSVTGFVANSSVLVFNFISGKLMRGEEAYALSPGEAVIANSEGRRVGIYMDAESNIHKVDTTCPHLGCEVQWNDAELSWDCPCHGSRYDVDGIPLEGPTLEPLKRID
ncbi:FAD dependent oxidoreductase [Desulfitobacterium dichloroeliminans LMG P-21439]|uniref:FAD dependent oxidoreductase n=1 Tax=Desulfitobacterium dichloroeliminans (strain LMG P-21439 / DCA1) TaxID=871963 RepID=L0F1F1_DESDL|nr:FAD-dependent oxidoreductase [Desulfitobacterium dichloroeliminans]AGA67674.1 FAD dependent oxidoreductase [Desulfitobacterium dichloroeliminans LMG P-21439]